jgi:acetyl-CoA acetyltransferase
MCGSSQQAVHFAAQAILSGDMDLVIAGGTEMMSHQPLGADYPEKWLIFLTTWCTKDRPR